MTRMPTKAERAKSYWHLLKRENFSFSSGTRMFWTEYLEGQFINDRPKSLWTYRAEGEKITEMVIFI